MTRQEERQDLERVAHRIITHLVEARSEDEAMAIARKVKPSALRVMADLLYVEAEGHGVKWLRAAVVSEARA